MVIELLTKSQVLLKAPTETNAEQQVFCDGKTVLMIFKSFEAGNCTSTFNWMHNTVNVCFLQFSQHR